MLAVLSSPASAPPRNLLASVPRASRALSIFTMCDAMGALPAAGGLLDQRADHYGYFQAFASAKAEWANIKAQE